ncbi:MAG: RNA 2',3'-cyclic phosphodiesterase [Glaciimonas sp.]|nr:RNA 2',3'-cyclic phosphodiesterase [Glaciimonas sp.]
MKTKESGVRLFYALWPDDATRAALIQLQAPMPGRITPAEDLHLTLVFLGTQPSAALPTLQAVLAALPASMLMLNVDCLGHFSKNGIIWAGMQCAPETLAALRYALLAALAQQNIAINQGARFKPHITLARDSGSDSAAQDMTPIIWRANHIALVQSTTTGSAPRYRLLASRRLEGTS